MTQPAPAKHELHVTTGDCEIVMTRAFDAPRAVVFDAFTKPELIRRWLLGPDGWSMPVCEVDLRVGGAFRYAWRNDADGREFGLHGTYSAISPGERIVYVENFDQPWYPDDATITTTFVEERGLTTVTMTQRFVSREARDIALESGMTTGVATSFDRLESVMGRTEAFSDIS
jgi:uncharacterized protein YndB with AHSA1/START domain